MQQACSGVYYVNNSPGTEQGLAVQPHSFKRNPIHVSEFKLLTYKNKSSISFVLLSTAHLRIN